MTTSGGSLMALPCRCLNTGIVFDITIKGDCEACNGWHPEGECPRDLTAADLDLDKHDEDVSVTNPKCTEGGTDWCCIDRDGTGLWCDSCQAAFKETDRTLKSDSRTSRLTERLRSTDEEVTVGLKHAAAEELDNLRRVLGHVASTYDQYRHSDVFPNELTDDAVRVGREALE